MIVKSYYTNSANIAGIVTVRNVLIKSISYFISYVFCLLSCELLCVCVWTWWVNTRLYEWMCVCVCAQCIWVYGKNKMNIFKLNYIDPNDWAMEHGLMVCYRLLIFVLSDTLAMSPWLPNWCHLIYRKHLDDDNRQQAHTRIEYKCSLKRIFELQKRIKKKNKMNFCRLLVFKFHIK